MATTAISPESLKRRLGRNPAPLLLDVRKQPAFAADGVMIAGAQWRDPQAIEAWLGELPKGAEIVAYCIHGHDVSQGVVHRLREHGFDACYLEGGIENWKAVGGAVERRS